MITNGILMTVSVIITSIMLVIISKQKPKNQMQQMFLINIILLFILCFFVLLQILLSEPLNIEPVYFEYLSYIGGCFIPVSLLLTSLIFVNTKISLRKYYLLLLIIPFISLIMLWTNDIHHLFFEKYSIYIKDVIYGPYFYVHAFYSYAVLLVAIILFITGAIKNSGFFSAQSMLILLGIIFPLGINILGTLKIIDITIYITPIMFMVAILFFTLAVFKFNFLKLNPVALQKIVDRISDGYIVLNEEAIITDYNEPFINMFDLKKYNVRNSHIYKFLNTIEIPKEEQKALTKKMLEAYNKDVEYKYTLYCKKVNKYFNMEMNNIKNKNSIIGTLILFKDVTQHMEDMKIIKSNQDVLIEQERLASLGQMIGGIAHNLKTPIMSIGGAAEGLTDLIKEYKLSIKDPEVTVGDHEQIAKEMDDWVDKIKNHISYMSDVISAVKGQAVTLSQSNEIYFSLEELIKRVDILMKHELKNAILYLKVTNNVDSSFRLKGNINGLVQVINNIISNAIQAYRGKTEETIELIFNLKNEKLVIAIKDNAGGIPKNVQDKLFNSMITTKGKNGTGLGLFMSYSNIKAHFGGDITFETKENVGTTFFITIPVR